MNGRNENGIKSSPATTSGTTSSIQNLLTAFEFLASTVMGKIKNFNPLNRTSAYASNIETSQVSRDDVSLYVLTLLKEEHLPLTKTASLSTVCITTTDKFDGLVHHTSSRSIATFWKKESCNFLRRYNIKDRPKQ